MQPYIHKTLATVPEDTVAFIWMHHLPLLIYHWSDYFPHSIKQPLIFNLHFQRYNSYKNRGKKSVSLKWKQRGLSRRLPTGQCPLSVASLQGEMPIQGETSSSVLRLRKPAVGPQGSLSESVGTDWRGSGTPQSASAQRLNGVGLFSASCSILGDIITIFAFHTEFYSAQGFLKKYIQGRW